MATTIVTKSGSGAPTASDLVAGELAVDLTNGRLYTEDSGGTVLELGLNPNGNVNVTGNVTAESLGIGTSSPLQALHVNSGTGNSAAIFESTDSTSQIWLKDSASSTTYQTGLGCLGDNLLFNNGTERMRIDANGNVGIGTSSPTRELEVTGTGNVYIKATAIGATDSAGLELDNAGVVWLIQNDDTSSDALTFDRAGIEAMRIDASGNVGIGTSTNESGYKLDVRGWGQFEHPSGDCVLGVRAGNNTGTSYIYFGDQASVNPAYIGYNHTSNSMSFKVNTAVAMSIDSSGDLLVGTTTSAGGGKLTVDVGGISGTLVSFQNSQNLGGSITVVSGGGTSYNTSSDQRLKENIVDAPSASNDIDAIQVRSFDWKADGSHQKYGMVAQELLEVAPEAVSAPEDPEEMMGVDYSKLVPMMLKEIQSLRARIAALES